MLDKNTKVVADLGRLIKLPEAIPEATGDDRQPSPNAIAAADAESLLALFFGTVATPGTSYTHADLELRQKDARRAAACLNACRGIETEDLESAAFTVLSEARWNALIALDRLAFASGAVDVAADMAPTDDMQGWIVACPPAETAQTLLDVFQDATTVCKSLLFQGLATLAEREQDPSMFVSNLYHRLAHSPTLTPALRLQEFAPGEGSRFLVGVARLPLADALPIGGTEDTVLITFGTDHPNDRAFHWFEANPRKHDTLEFEWLSGKFPHLHPATLNVAHHVVAYLLGRVAWGAKWAPELHDWSPNWREQLEALRTLAIGKFDAPAAAAAAAAASSDGDKSAAQSAGPAQEQQEQEEVSNAG